MSQRIYGFEPLLCNDPEIVILGTLPGGESLEHREYYYSNSNRIWQVLSLLTHESVPLDYDQKKALLARHRIALWDYYDSAIRPGSDDRKIKDGIPNNIVDFLRNHPNIHIIAINGFGKYKKFGKSLADSVAAVFPDRHIRVLCLPETSGANKNHGWGNLHNLASEWSKIFD